MITKEDLVVGNEVFVTENGCEHTATITKVGRKYTYTNSRYIVIDNCTLWTKHTGYGYGSYPIYRSKEQYITRVKNTKYIRQVKEKIKDLDMSIGLAKRLNHELNLGIDYE